MKRSLRWVSGLDSAGDRLRLVEFLLRRRPDEPHLGLSYGDLTAMSDSELSYWAERLTQMLERYKPRPVMGYVVWVKTLPR